LIASLPKSLQFIIITGHAGSGKSTALAALEDNGFYCVDNMPVALLPKFVELTVDRGVEAKGYAFVMDLREKDFLNSYQKIIQDIQKQGYTFTLLFLSADTETLVQRYSQTRRHHPLYDGNDLVACIQADKKQLRDIEKEADRVIDTTKYTVHDLKAILQKVAKDHNVEIPMRIHIMSFGFMHGIPHDADHIMDVRFLKNPYFVSELSHLVGTTKKIKAFVLKDDQTNMFLARYLDLLDYLVPLYKKEGKAYLTISIGCTGGRHRSVVIAQEVYEHIIRTGHQVMITHRDINRK
jgi:UPF0042 nucleotide-binding protein